MPTLFPYQRTGVAYLMRHPCALLADEPGVGKTAQAIMSIPYDSPVLVLCPKIAKGVWRREFNLWRPGEFDVKLLTGRAQFRWPKPGEVCCTTYDSTPKDLLTYPAEGTYVILDELQLAKNPRAQRTKGTRAICKVSRFSHGRLIGLTGTPLLNSGEELWDILDLLQLAKKAYGSKERFVKVFGGRVVENEYYLTQRKTNPRTPRFRYEWDGVVTPEARSGFQKVSLRRLQAEVLKDLPERLYNDIPLELDAPGKAAIKSMMTALKQSGLSVESLVEIIESGRYREGFDIGVLARARMALAIAKIPAMLNYLGDFEENQKPLVVFSAHRGPIETLTERPGWAVIHGGVSASQRTKIEDAFQAGKLLGVGMTIKAGGVAITLTHAAHCLFVDREWVPALNRQAEMRLARIGQKFNVLVSTLIYDHPVELLVYAALFRKTALEKEVVGL